MSSTAKPSLSTDTTKQLVVRPVSINQIVAYNIAWYRKAAGLTQEELGQRLGGWTKVAVSAAERSWDGKRVRKFDADELVAIARAIGIPVPALFLPPEDSGTVVAYELEGTSDEEHPTELIELLPFFLLAPIDETPVIAAFRQRLMKLGAAGYLSEVDRAQDILLNAKMRARALEVDAQERHRHAMGTMGTLIDERIDLERQVDKLRAFERQYRSNLLEFMESQIATLRSDEGDRRRFVLKKAPSGYYHFNLVAPNGQVVATSETYRSKQSALNGIESVKNSASYSMIDDQTGDE